MEMPKDGGGEGGGMKGKGWRWLGDENSKSRTHHPTVTSILSLTFPRHQTLSL